MEEYLLRHLPECKVQSLLNYLEEHNCSLKITKPRVTKRGDFRQNGKKLSISINHDENSYRFLFTLVHELAHLETFIQLGAKHKPHGDEWKSNFRSLFKFFKVDEEFKKDPLLYDVITEELINPRACSGVNVIVEKAFAKYDAQEGVYLGDLDENELFEFRGHLYKKLEERRTRVLCLNVKNSRKYTINKGALVNQC